MNTIETQINRFRLVLAAGNRNKKTPHPRNFIFGPALNTGDRECLLSSVAGGLTSQPLVNTVPFQNTKVSETTENTDRNS